MAVSFDSKKAHEFVRLWADICAREGNVDREKAEWATAVLAWVGGIGTFGSFCYRMLGLAAATSKSLAERAEALAVVPNSAVWESVQWPGVMHVARIPDAKKRARVCSVIAAEREAGKHVSRDRLRVILREQAPDVFAPKPPVPETPKDREQTRMAAAAKRAAAIVTPDAKAARDEAAAAKARAEVLARAIKRLMAGPLPVLGDLLTAEERAAAGLPAKRKARAS